MSTSDILNRETKKKSSLLPLLLILSSFLILSACVTTPKRSTKRPSKPAQNISVGSGENRIMATFAMQYLGTPYVYGGESPAEGGFDCSGLVQYAAKKTLNQNLPRRAVEQVNSGKSIILADAQAGDLLFFNTDGQPYSHVGIYIGKTHFIHAPSSGGVVRVEDYTMDYWRKRFTAARRLP